MVEFFKFIGRSFRREAGTIWVIFRSISFVGFAPLATAVAEFLGFETGAWKWWLIPITAFCVPAVLLWRSYKYGHDLEAKATTKLAIEYGNSERFRKHGHVTKPTGTKLPAFFIKGIAKVIGNQTISGCQIFATDFEKLNGQDYVPIPPFERIRLKWALEDTNQIDITPSAPAHFGLISARPEKGRFLISTDQIPLIPHDSFEQPGKYRMKLILTGNNTAEAVARVVVNWNGVWNQLSVSEQ